MRVWGQQMLTYEVKKTWNREGGYHKSCYSLMSYIRLSHASHEKIASSMKLLKELGYSLFQFSSHNDFFINQANRLLFLRSIQLCWFFCNRGFKIQIPAWKSQIVLLFFLFLHSPLQTDSFNTFVWLIKMVSVFIDT